MAALAAAAVATSVVPAAAAAPPASVTVVGSEPASSEFTSRLETFRDAVAAAAAEASPGLGWPTRGEVTSEFGLRDHPVHGDVRPHDGIDVAAPTGEPVVAGAAGTVVAAEEQSGYGLVVVVDHGQGVETLHAHLSSIDVATGQTVDAGQPLGAVGATGTATGPHLHLEVSVDGEAVDPRHHLAPTG